jgi:hypothetical protein
MATITGYLSLIRTRVLAELTAIFLSGWWYTNAGLVGTLLRTLSGHLHPFDLQSLCCRNVFRATLGTVHMALPCLPSGNCYRASMSGTAPSDGLVSGKEKGPQETRR